MTISRLGGVVFVFALSLALLPVHFELADSSVLGWNQRLGQYFKATVPVSLGLILLSIVALYRIITGYHLFGKIIFRLAILCAALAAFYWLLAGLPLIYSIKLILPIIVLILVLALPRVDWNLSRSLCVIPAVMCLAHLVSILIHYNPMYLEVNHNVFFWDVFARIFRFEIYSPLVVYSETLSLIAILFLLVVRVSASQEHKSDVIYLSVSWLGFLIAMTLGLIGARKLFILFFLVILCYLWMRKDTLAQIMRRSYLRVVTAGYFVFLVINYEWFIPAVRRVTSSYMSGNLDGRRLSKYGEYVGSLQSDHLSAETVSPAAGGGGFQSVDTSILIFGSGDIGSYHNFFLMLLASVGIVGFALFVSLILYILKIGAHHMHGIFSMSLRPELIVILVYVALECFVNTGLSQSYYAVSLGIVFWLLKECGSRDAVETSKDSRGRC